MLSPKQVLLTFILFSFLVLSSPSLILAQNSGSVQGAASLGVARVVEAKDKNIKDGSLVSSSQQGATLSTVPYDAQILGVVARDAGIIMNTAGGGNTVPVISNGTVYVLVATKEGPIKKGDYITSSTLPGVGVKALKEGYVIGRALEDYTNSNPTKVDKIAVDLELHYINTRPTFPGALSDILKIAFLPTKDSPAAIFKYIVAAGVIIASFVLGFLSFGRTAAKGVEALGRNPAAGKIIHLGIIFNVGIVVVIVLAGLTVSFLILRL
jgi:F0F1-type ATP synthase membrane subunit c/vacuolar-type H+-ATPase subunit K